MQSPTPTVGRLIFGAGLLTLVLALTVGSLVFPITTSQIQPPPAGQEWIGVPPKVDVDCGSLIQPHDPVWPQTFRDRVDPRDDPAVRGCDDASSTRRTMAIAFGVLALATMALLAVAIRSRRRGTLERGSSNSAAVE